MSDRATPITKSLVSADAPELRMLRAGELPWDRDRIFSACIHGKRVAVVGPARTLLSTNRGEWIDSHDIVVRFNDAFEYFQGDQLLIRDIGSRTDMLYCNQVILRKNILGGRNEKKKFARFAKSSGLKYIVCTNNSLSYGINGEARSGCDAIDRGTLKLFRAYLADEAPEALFRVVESASSLSVKWLNGNWGRTGFIGLLDLLGFAPQQLNITGMTFYHRGGHLSTNGPELYPTGNRDGQSSISPDGRGHNSFMELEVLQKLLAAYGSRIGIDEPLRTLLESEGHPQS